MSNPLDSVIKIQEDKTKKLIKKKKIIKKTKPVEECEDCLEECSDWWIARNGKLILFTGTEKDLNEEFDSDVEYGELWEFKDERKN
jgi:hypothetical protein